MTQTQAASTGRLSYLIGTLHRLPIAMYGFAFICAWATWIRVGQGVSVSASWPLSITCFRTLTFAALLAVSVLAQRSRWRASSPDNTAPAKQASQDARGFLILQVVCVAIGELVTLSGAIGIVVSPMLVTLVYGAVPAVLNVAWGVLYMRLRIKDAFACVLVTYVMSALLNGIVFFIPGFVQPYAASAMLLCGGFLYLPANNTICRLTVAGRDETVSGSHPSASVSTMYSGEDRKPPLWKFALCLFAYAFVLGILQLLIEDDQSAAGELLTHGIEIAIALAFLASIYIVRRPMRFAPMIIVLFAVLSGGLVLAMLGANALALVLFKITHSFLGIVVWMVVVDFCRHTGMGSTRVVSLLFLMRNLAPALLFPIGCLFYSQAWGSAATGAVALWGLALVTLLFVTEKDLVALKLFDGVLSQAPTGRTSVAEVEERCRSIAERYGLTPREEQVLAVLCLGKSKAYIAQGLGMSEATVKSHVRSIYAKLGVHNKNELQELVGL